MSWADWHGWIWATLAACTAAPVWWVLKEMGYVTWCPIQTFAQQSARTFSRLRRK